MLNKLLGYIRGEDIAEQVKKRVMTHAEIIANQQDAELIINVIKRAKNGN